MPEAERRPNSASADPPAATAEQAAPQDVAEPPGPELGEQAVAPDPDYSAAGVPSLDYVRDRIEGRYATSVGSAELASETPQAQALEEQLEERERAGHDRLAEIRRSLGTDSTGPDSTGPDSTDKDTTGTD